MSLELGNNVWGEVKDGKLVLTFDLTKDLGDSSTGKTRVVAKTSGWKRFDTDGEEFILNLNLMKAKKRR